MKVLLILLVFFSTLPPAQANHPLLDQEVFRLHWQYYTARKPTPEDLKPGRPWECFYRSAYLGSKMTTHSTDYYAFRTIPGDPSRVTNEGSFQASTFQFVKGSLEGAYMNGPKVFGYENVRVRKSGELIVEFRSAPCKGWGCVGGAVAGIQSQESVASFVIGYRSCRLN